MTLNLKNIRVVYEKERVRGVVKMGVVRRIVG
jgi:hypothetical protein